MIKTKATDAGKVGDNYPIGATLTGTEKTRVGGQMPATAPLPTMADQQPWLTVGGSANMPNPKATDDLPLFNVTPGFTDTGASSTGDVGGAA